MIGWEGAGGHCYYLCVTHGIHSHLIECPKGFTASSAVAQYCGRGSTSSVSLGRRIKKGHALCCSTDLAQARECFMHARSRRRCGAPSPASNQQSVPHKSYLICCILPGQITVHCTFSRPFHHIPCPRVTKVSFFICNTNTRNADYRVDKCPPPVFAFVLLCCAIGSGLGWSATQPSRLGCWRCVAPT